MKILYLILGFLVLVGFGTVMIVRYHTDDQYFVTVGTQSVIVELARSPEEHAKGLSGRDSLPADRGMLFIFDSYQQPSFWMKDMRFAIDILWINNGRVVGLESDVQPSSNDILPLYTPKTPIKYVLEVPAGWSTQNGVQIGTVVTMENMLD
jgi:hypothetical protein